MRQRDSAIPGRQRGARGAGGMQGRRAAPSPQWCRSLPAAAGGTRGRRGHWGLLRNRCGASELGLSWFVCYHFLRWQPGATGLRFAHFARRGVAGVPRPPLPPERARSGGGRPGPDKGREGGGGGAERSAAWPARGRCPHPRLPLRTAQSCSRAMFLSVGAPRAPEAAARWSRPGGVASLRPHRRPPPLPSSGRSASARRAGSPTAAASWRAEESQRRPLPRRAPLKWRAPGAPAHLSSERSAACRPRGHCARAAPPSRVPRPPLASRASRAAHPSLPVSSRSLELPRSDFSIPSRRTSSSGA